MPEEIMFISQAQQRCITESVKAIKIQRARRTAIKDAWGNLSVDRILINVTKLLLIFFNFSPAPSPFFLLFLCLMAGSCFVTQAYIFTGSHNPLASHSGSGTTGAHCHIWPNVIFLRCGQVIDQCRRGFLQATLSCFGRRQVCIDTQSTECQQLHNHLCV